MDALWERTDFVWTLTWLGHRCSVGTDKDGCRHWKNTGKRKNLTIKHTRMPPMCKKPHENARYVQETQENARENKARPPTI